jgi:hypothetical protein
VKHIALVAALPLATSSLAQNAPTAHKTSPRAGFSKNIPVSAAKNSSKQTPISGVSE